MTIDLNAIEARLREDREGTGISPGPWHVSKVNPDWICHGDPDDPEDAYVVADTFDGCYDGDIEFIARAREDVPALVAEVRRLRGVLEDIAEADCAYGDGCPTFGTRHGQCVGCKAREGLGHARGGVL